MNNIIYWFSGTGNSLYAAELLAESMGETRLAKIDKGARTTESVGGDGRKIGFVFPSYYGEMPRLVRSFVEGLTILPGTDLFAVVTMGAFGQGTVKALRILLDAKGLTLRYGVGLRMPANYILKYDPAIFGAKSRARVEKKLGKSKRRVARIADDIASGTQKVQENPITAKTLYENIEALDEQFRATEKCTGCGLCARVCPVNNIELANSKPTWSRRCEHCVACISWCPTAAIEYGQVTVRRTRYRNPYVKAVDFCEREG